MIRTWRQVLFIVQPETLLRWHRELFHSFWKHKSKADARQPKLSPETIALIKEMASKNRLWGAERIRGELLKLGIRVCKRTIQKYMRQVCPPRPRGQKWATFLQNHAADIWACDFLQITDLFFRPLFAFFLIELQSRKVIHVGVTRCPTDAWTAQQLRKRLRMDTRRSISFAIMRASLGPVSLVWQQRAASRFSKRRIMRHAPMRSANAFWAVFDESAWTTY
jgi:putative transposase